MPDHERDREQYLPRKLSVIIQAASATTVGHIKNGTIIKPRNTTPSSKTP
jgi:hypothetical protein